MIRQFFTDVFRYRLGAIYMLIGYVLSFVVIFNGSALYWASEDAAKAARAEQYQHCTVVMTEYGIPLADYLEAAKSVQCNVSLRDVPMFLDAGSVTRLIRVGLAKPEGDAINGCMIGDALVQYTTQQDGQMYLSLDGSTYAVSKVRDGKGGSVSEDIYLPYSMLSGHDKTVIQDNLIMAEIVFESNELDTEQQRRQFENALSDLRGGTVRLQSDYTEMDTGVPAASKAGIIMCIFAYLFCLVNCIVVCEFWLYQRRHELAVRRAFHFRGDRIIGLLFQDMIRIVMLACMIYLLLQVVLLGPCMQHFGVQMTYDIRSIGFMLVMIPVSSGITLLPYLYRLSRRSYVVWLKEGM